MFVQMKGLSINTGSLTYDMLVENLKNKTYKKVIVLTGEGISSNTGWPDFRSPNSLIHDIVEKHGLSDPKELFTLTYI